MKELPALPSITKEQEAQKVQEALVTGKAHLESVIENMMSGVLAFEAVCDTSGRIVDLRCTLADDQVQRLIGQRIRLANPGMVGETITTLFPEITASGLFDSLVQVIKTGSPTRIELADANTQGAGGWLQIAAARLNNGIVGMLTDITAIKRLTEDMRRSEARYQLLADTVTDVITTFTPDGIHTYCSPAIQSILGYAPEEILGASLRFHPDELSSVTAALARLSAKQPTTTCEVRVQHKHGHWVWMEFSIRMIVNPETGTAVEYMAVARDIARHSTAEETVRQNVTQFRSYIEISNDLFCSLDSGGIVTYASPSSVRVLGRPPEAVIGHPFEEFIHSDDLPVCEDLLRRLAVEVGGHGEVVFRFALPDGTWRWGHASALSLHEGGVSQGIAGVMRDITALRETEAAVERARDFYHHILNEAPSMIWYSSASGTLDFCNKALLAYTGHSLEQQRGGGWIETVHPDDREHLWDVVRSAMAVLVPFNTEYRLRRADGEYRLVVCSGRPFLDEHEQFCCIGHVYDITDRRAAEQEMWQAAHYDPLTGLPNRSLFRQRLEKALVRHQRDCGTAAVLFLDLDRFKWVNDTLGHDAGDAMLCEVARRLQSCIRHSDTVARWAGDEFLVLLNEVTGESGAAQVAAKILDHLSQPLLLRGQEVFPSGSIGIALTCGKETADAVISRADASMYRAKQGGKNRYVYDAIGWSLPVSAPS